MKNIQVLCFLLLSLGLLIEPQAMKDTPLTLAVTLLHDLKINSGACVHRVILIFDPIVLINHLLVD